MSARSRPGTWSRQPPVTRSCRSREGGRRPQRAALPREEARGPRTVGQGPTLGKKGLEAPGQDDGSFPAGQAMRHHHGWPCHWAPGPSGPWRQTTKREAAPWRQVGHRVDGCPGGLLPAPCFWHCGSGRTAGAAGHCPPLLAGGVENSDSPQRQAGLPTGRQLLGVEARQAVRRQEQGQAGMRAEQGTQPGDLGKLPPRGHVPTKLSRQMGDENYL